MKKYSLIFLVVLLFSCESKKTNSDSSKIKIVTTTTMITDMVKNIGGDKIELQGLMGAGVDPHLYKASEGDVSKLGDISTLLNPDVVEGIMDGALVELKR